MSKRNTGIMCYGTEADRVKLAALAELVGKSSSQFLIDYIREQYATVFGEDDSHLTDVNHW